MVLPSDVVEQDMDMETLAGEEGVENTAEGPTEGIVVPLDSEGGKGWYLRDKNLGAKGIEISLRVCTHWPFHQVHLSYGDTL